MSFLARHRRLFFILVMVILSLVLSCLLLVVLDALGQRFFFDKLYYRKSVRHGYVSELRALTHSSPLLMGNRVRDVQDLIQGKSESSQEQFTIALIGDSMIYGEGVLEKQRFASLLEKKLNTIRPTNVVVLALPGDHLVDNYTKFLLAQQSLHPDVYVFGLMNNDLMFDTLEKYPGESEIFQQLRDACPLPLYATFPDSSAEWDSWILNTFKASFSVTSANRCILDRVAQKIAEHDVRVMTLTFFDAPLPEEFTDEMSEKQREEARQLDEYAKAFQRYDMKNILPHQTKDFGYQPVSAREGHPSAETHAKYADILFDELRSHTEWGFVQDTVQND